MRRSQRLRSAGPAKQAAESAQAPASAVRRSPEDALPLSALLSQLLVAFTVEADNEFERQMAEAGHRGERLSLGLWLNLLQFVPDADLSISDLVARVGVSGDQVRHQLACLERWGHLRLGPDRREAPAGLRAASRRSGWGSGRGIRLDWRIGLTGKGRAACVAWRPIADLVGRRWEARWGASRIDTLRDALSAVDRGLGLTLPEGFPGGSPLAVRDPDETRRSSAPQRQLAGGLARVLMAFTLEFDREAGPPLAMCASTLRVLTPVGALVSDVPRLTGSSPEVTAVGWRWRRSGLLTVGPAPAGRRGQSVRVTPAGQKAQQQYLPRARRIEARWRERLGGVVGALRQVLEEIRSAADADGPVLAQGLVPPPGVVRTGAAAPALGRREVGPAAAQRRRDLAAQTRAFVAEPAGALPHYPLWDMNRGFGP